MIGPPSSFYDSDALVRSQADSQSQYQQWIDAFDSQQQQQQQQPHDQLSMHHHQQSTSFHHHQQPQPYRQQIAQARDPYAYPQQQDHFSQTSHYVDPVASTTTQSAGAAATAPPLADSTSYHIQNPSDPYTGYYSNSNPATGTNTPDPNMGQTASYTAAPEPLYQQQQRVQQLLGSRPTHSLPTHSPSTKVTSAQPEPSTTAAIQQLPASSSSSKTTSGSKARKQVHPHNRMTASTASPPETTPKATAKRKRPNPGAAPPPKLYRFNESGSGSEDDDGEGESPFNSGGISVGMGGMGVVGGGGRNNRL
ncbi:hypothetical protein H0H87_011722 [Tephrocybe sp. NHM501043]|nr:hypothetical protein H0H87_011722 [Tephrocybe sp. NHM501043]